MTATTDTPQNQIEQQAPVHHPSPRDILCNKASDLATRANDKYEEQAYDEALILYQRASEILMGVLNNEKSPQAKVDIALQLKEVIDSKESVKQEIERSTIRRGDSLRRESQVCQVILTIENISVHQIVGDDRKLLGNGVLRILHCNTTTRRPRSTSIPPDGAVGEGEVHIPAASNGLYMLQLQPDNDQSQQFQFPLTKSVPCLCTAPGYYIFPMPAGNLFYGLVFPTEIPHAYCTIFEKVLDDCCCLRKVPSFAPQPPKEAPVETVPVKDIVVAKEPQVVVKVEDMPDTPAVPFTVRALNLMSTGITVGAGYLVDGITFSSQKIAYGTRTGGDFIMNHITPNAEPARVPSQLATTVYVAGKLSPACVAVSKALISSLATLAEEIGSAVAEGVVNSTLGNKIGGPKKAPNPTATAAKELGKNSLAAFGDVWQALDQAGRLLLSESSTVTVEIIETKYGPEAGKLAKDGMQVTGNIIETVYNVNQLGYKSLATKTAKKAGQKTVSKLLGPDQQLNGRQKALSAPEPVKALPAPEPVKALPPSGEVLMIKQK